MAIYPLAETDRWVLTPRPNPAARVRLFCFPNAGMGMAAFRGWADELPSDIEVSLIRLPGRDGRFKEPQYRALGSLADAGAEAIAPLLDVPFAMFGHSMGAWICFEVARQLRRRGLGSAERLFVSARRAPHLPDRYAPLRGLSDDEFIVAIRRRFDGIPKVVLENKDLLDLMLPTLRADVSLLETYTYVAEDPLASSISVFGGLQDQEATTAELDAWRLHTTGDFTLRLLPGGHFFPNTSRPALLSEIAGDLGGLR